MSRAIHPRPVLPALLGAITLLGGTGQLEAQSYTLPFNPDLYQDAMDSTQPIPSDYGTVDGLVTVTSSAHTNFGDNPYATNPGLCYWHETYGDLVGVAFTCARAAGVSEFAFQPAPGHRLFLESLQLGEYFGRSAWSHSIRPPRHRSRSASFCSPPASRAWLPFVGGTPDRCPPPIARSEDGANGHKRSKLL